MTDKDEKQFAMLMITLYEIYEKKGSATKTEIYFNILEEYPIEKIKKGVTNIVKKRVYSSFPKPADIIEAIEGSYGDIEERALNCFIEAKQAIMRYGIYEHVNFDPIVNKTIDSLGTWQEWCLTPENEWTWKGKDFVKRYNTFFKQFKDGLLADVPLCLSGINTNPERRINDVIMQYAVEAPKQIDEPHKELNVLNELGKKIKYVNNENW